MTCRLNDLHFDVVPFFAGQTAHVHFLRRGPESAATAVTMVLALAITSSAMPISSG
jgi:hypothetical protein